MLLPMFLLSRLKVLSILCLPNHMSCVTLYPRHYWASIKIPLASPRLWIVPMKAEECCMAQIPLLPQQGKWAPCALILCQALHQALDPVRWALQIPLTHRDKTKAQGGICPGSHSDRGGQPRVEFGWPQGPRAKPWHSPRHHCQYIPQH